MQCGDPVEQVALRPGMTVGELVDALSRAGAYNGGALARAAGIYERMLRDTSAVKFFGLAGAMVAPAGMGRMVSDLIDRGHIDVLVTTGANMTHDIIEALGCRHFHGTAECSDIDCTTTRSTGSTMYSSPTRRSSGSRSSCSRRFANFPTNRFPSPTPEPSRGPAGPGDSGLGGPEGGPGLLPGGGGLHDRAPGPWLFSQTRRATVDAFADMKPLIDLCFSAERTGAVLVGGGVPKNFILQSMLMTPNGFTYAVQLTKTCPTSAGSRGPPCTRPGPGERSPRRPRPSRSTGTRPSPCRSSWPRSGEGRTCPN